MFDYYLCKKAKEIYDERNGVDGPKLKPISELSFEHLLEVFISNSTPANKDRLLEKYNIEKVLCESFARKSCYYLAKFSEHEYK